MNCAAVLYRSAALIVGLMCGLMRAADAEDAFERAYESDDFILSHDGEARIEIGLDTTAPEILRLAVDLQDALYRLGGARPPLRHLVGAPDGSPSAPWNLIVLVPAWPGSVAAVESEPARFTVSMESLQPGYSINCLKRLRVDYRSPADARDALEWLFTEYFQAPFPVPAGFTEPGPVLSIRFELPESDSDGAPQSVHVVYPLTRSTSTVSKRAGVAP